MRVCRILFVHEWLREECYILVHSNASHISLWGLIPVHPVSKRYLDGPCGSRASRGLRLQAVAPAALSVWLHIYCQFISQTSCVFSDMHFSITRFIFNDGNTPDVMRLPLVLGIFWM